MSDYIALAAIAALFLSAIISYLIYTRSLRDLERLREYEFFTEKFYKAANVLAVEQDTPDGMIVCLEALNRLIADEAEAKEFFAYYSRRAYENIKKGEQTSPDPEFARFLKAHPNLEPVV